MNYDPWWSGNYVFCAKSQVVWRHLCDRKHITHSRDHLWTVDITSSKYVSRHKSEVISCVIFLHSFFVRALYNDFIHWYQFPYSRSKWNGLDDATKYNNVYMAAELRVTVTNARPTLVCSQNTILVSACIFGSPRQPALIICYSCVTHEVHTWGS